MPGGGYTDAWWSTSFASPHAAGLVGLMWSANPALRGQVEDTIEIIQDSSRASDRTNVFKLRWGLHDQALTTTGVMARSTIWLPYRLP